MLIERRVERFLRRSGMSATRFGRNVVRDPRFVFDLRRGRRLGQPTLKKLVAWLDEQEARLDSCGR